MEIVSIEKRTFEAMVARFDRFVSRMEAICQRHGEKTMSEWMDNQDVCRMLNISPRTLQTLRDNGTLAYSQIVVHFHKCTGFYVHYLHNHLFKWLVQK